ncbi:MAG: helix-turn-helix transcriptional regulator [Clostridia bacterium]|nr:helix-turn-helix transcriptional regulator [Clostridia bacterium]
MIYSDICKRIRELRIKRGLTQVKLASILGVSKSVISSYENGVHLPPYDILVRLSNIFGVSCDYLIGVSESNYISTEGLTEAQIQAIKNIVEELRKINR